MSRPTWNQYFLNMLPSIGARSTCDRGKCGAIITRDNTILSTGYAGAPKGFPHCDDVGHLFEYVTEENAFSEGVSGWEKHLFIYKDSMAVHCIRTIHAEMNAIYHAAEIGVSLKGGTLYSTMFPCFRCAMAIVQVGIIEVFAANAYHASEQSHDIFMRAGVRTRTLSTERLYE